MSISKERLRLYAVTDRTWLNGRELCGDVEKAILGGATLVQLREKNLDFESLIGSAEKIKAVCGRYNVPLIINDSVEAVTRTDADGVHIGQDDTDAVRARAMLGRDKIIGVTARTVEQAVKAERDGADYIGAGAVFGTSTKDGAKKMELETLRAITAAVSIPVIAIGGVTSDNVTLLKNCGIAGAAVVSGIFAQENIEKAARELLTKIKEITED